MGSLRQLPTPHQKKKSAIGNLSLSLLISSSFSMAPVPPCMDDWFLVKPNQVAVKELSPHYANASGNYQTGAFSKLDRIKLECDSRTCLGKRNVPNVFFTYQPRAEASLTSALIYPWEAWSFADINVLIKRRDMSAPNWLIPIDSGPSCVS